MKTKVILGGHLGRKFGREWTFDLDCPSPREAVSALSAVCQGFRAWVLKNARPGYHVFNGRKSVTPEDLSKPTFEREIVIMPALTGAKSGWISVILGGVLIAGGIALSIIAPYSTPLGAALVKAGVGLAISVGVSLATAGINTLLTNSPDTAKKDDQAPNYVFSGPVNTVGVGHCVPVCYGRLEVGSQVISNEITQQRPASGGRIPDGTPGRFPGKWHDHMPKDGN